MMNHYGVLALRHWQNTKPQELAKIENPQQYFADLGEQVAAEARRRAEALESAMGSDFVANLRMLNEARATAESEVLRELVYTEPETDS